MLLYPACRRIAYRAVVAVAHVGCLGGGSSVEDSSPPPTSNRAPTITGSPDTSLVVNENYEFRPSASDPDGDALTFRAQNLPAWASIDTSTGRMIGTPGNADVGRFEDIRISVSDGQYSDSISPFSIDVNQFAPGNVTISWLPPTTNADGTPITDLAGYRIYYGRSADELGSVAAVNNPGIRSRVIDNLSPATWFFAMTAINGAGLESVRIPVGSVTIS